MGHKEELKTDHKYIYLQPECCADPSVGRVWCEHDAPEDCEEGNPWIRYVRSDLCQPAPNNLTREALEHALRLLKTEDLSLIDEINSTPACETKLRVLLHKDRNLTLKYMTEIKVALTDKQEQQDES